MKQKLSISFQNIKLKVQTRNISMMVFLRTGTHRVHTGTGPQGNLALFTINSSGSLPGILCEQGKNKNVL